MARLGRIATTTAALGLGAALLAPTTAQAQHRWAAPPPGTSYWVDDDGFLIVIKRAGKQVRIGNPLAPCYTGIRQADGSYRGGGYNQGSGYWHQRVRFLFQPGQQATKVKWSKYGTSLWYTHFTRREALRRATSPKVTKTAFMFRECELR